MGYSRNAIHGFGWMGTLRGFVRGLNFLKTAILARILSPAEYGLFGIVVLVISLLETFMETGVNAVLIQSDEDIQENLNTAWVVSIIRGILISSLIFLSAHFLASFFQAPAVSGLLLLAASVPLIRGFINPAVVSFQKELQFHKEFSLRALSLLAETIVSLYYVFVYHSVAGLVYGIIASAMSELTLSFLWLKKRPRLEFNVNRFYKIIHFGRWVTLSGIFTYMADSFVDISVAKFLNVGSLGIYQMAYKISNLSFSEVTDATSRVTFPVYSKIAGDRQRLKKAYFKTLSAISLFSLIITGLLVLFPNQLVFLFLGPRWSGVVTPLRILAIAGLIRGISSSAAPLFLSVAKPKLLATLSIIRFLVVAVFLLPLIFRFELIGACLAALISSLAIQPLIWVNVIRLFP